MDNCIDKTYNPSLIEKDIYDLWSKNDLFKINFESGKKVYSVVMPPPNITGVLHMGHALNFTLQDILVRFKRMMGFEAGNYERYCEPDKLRIVHTPHEHDLMMDDPSLDIIVPELMKAIGECEPEGDGPCREKGEPRE